MAANNPLIKMRPMGALAIMFVMVMLSMTISSPSQASDAPHGWRWYEDPKKPTIKKQKKPPQHNTVTRTLSATKQLEWFQKEHKEVIAAATIDPKNKQKQERLMRFNQYISKQTSQTGMTFKEVLLENPDLSYIKDRPVEQAARSTYLLLEREKKVLAVKQMVSEGWGFFFIYEGKDPISQKLAPSIQRFSNTHGIELLGVTKDKVEISAIDNNVADNKNLQVPYTPALILVNPKTQKMKPLVYGFIATEDLLGRFYNVATDYQESDF
ncbi:type-F conjugative transfer system pilin assembly protein TraF [Moritella viscosa]|uniref:type-F conjugative transfer system pilin assembly protein TraF n=1 Tax=Moritella viscosa TaxID=80854 RepID=UPI0009212835|nr:type-F conjugative transfer system pilin assembly protein TraF [Moritella viscosa]SGZ09533.1 Conjugative transfer protein TraF [Moritella viscosa]